MNVVLGKKENNTVSFTFELGADDFKKATQEAYLQSRGQFNMPGFRKGRVPRQIIEMNYGKEIFYEDAVNLLLPEAYSKAVEELELEPVDQPVIDIDEIVAGEDITVKVDVEVKPEVKLGKYKGLELEDIELEVTEEMVNFEIDKVRNQNARLVDAEDKTIEKDDVANIDFKGFVDGVAFEGGEAEAYDLTIGAGMFIPGFEEQLIGHKKGEDVTVEVKFPEDYEENLAGKEATFEVKINSVRVKELPELDDDFALDVSDFDTFEEYKNDIRKTLEEQAKDQAEATKREKLVEKAVENAEFDVPQGMIDSEIEQELGQMDFRLRQQGLELGTYLELTGGDVLGLREQIQPMAKMRVKGNLVLEKIAEVEGIEATEEDIDAELTKMAEYHQAEDVERFIEDMKKQGDLNLLASGIKNSKVIDLLIENAK